MPVRPAGPHTPPRPPELAGLALSDPAAVWAELGFSVREGTVDLGGVRLELGAPGRGIVGWRLRGLGSGAGPGLDLDGLPTPGAAAPVAPGQVAHANGAVGLDHLVVVSADFERTLAALGAAGMPARRIRHVGAGADATRQGFRRLGPAILEVVESRQGPAGGARFWGLTLVAADLDAFVARLGPERIGAPRDAVQPGRRIAALRRGAGLSFPAAVMDPEPDRIPPPPRGHPGGH